MSKEEVRKMSKRVNQNNYKFIRSYCSDTMETLKKTHKRVKKKEKNSVLGKKSMKTLDLN